MTGALRVMVEAMWREVERQKAFDAALPWGEGGHIKGIEASRKFDPGQPDDGQITSVFMMGRFDMEKVARAGLLAIRDTDESTAYFGSWAVGPGGHPAKKRELVKAFAAMIDAITKGES